MLERLIYRILDEGRTHINEDPSFIEQYFCQFDLMPQETAAIRDYWLSKRFHRRNLDNTAYEPVTGVNIVHQYPRISEQPQFPCWAIVLVGENEHDDKGRFLGNDLDDIIFDGELVSQDGSVLKKTYAVFTYSDNPDVTLYYYELSKCFLRRARDILASAENGVLDTAFSGNDMAPDPRYEPEHMFVRRLQIETMILEGAVRSPQPERAFQVGGAFVRNEQGLDVTTFGDGETISPQVTTFGGE